MKRTAILTAAVLTLSAMPLQFVKAADVPASGICGENITWEIEDGVLTLTGSGATYDYQEGARHWDRTLTADVEKVVIEEGITRIGNYCFNEFETANYVVKVELPETLVSIGEWAFYNSPDIKIDSLPDSLEYIGERAFNNTRITKAMFPPKMDWLPDGCYANTRIEEIEIPERIRKIGDGCFAACFELRSCIFPDTDIEIGSACFAGCNHLRIRLPNTMTALPDGLFRGCKYLNKVEIPPGVTEIGESCFASAGLKWVDIPAGCTKLGDACFSQTKLESVVIPDGVTELPDSCFAGCAQLKSVSFPDTVTRIGKNCFSGCDLLEDFHLPENDSYTVGYNALPKQYLGSQGDFLILHDSELYLCQMDAESVRLPEQIRKIDMMAFQDAGLIESVVINDGAETIESEAFCNCPKLRSLEIPASVTEIAKDAVMECGSFTTVYGEYYTAAHAFALQNGYEFVPLHDEPELPARVPDYEADTFSFGNNPGLFSGAYQMSDWAKAMLLDYSQRPVQTADAAARQWSGSCYGLSSVTVLTAAGILSPADLDPDADTLHDVRPTEDALSVINYYHMIQTGSVTQNIPTSVVNLAEAIRLAENYQNGGDPFVLTFRRIDSSGHAVVGYGIERGEWEWDGVTYDRRIRTWDCNYSAQTDKSQFYFDSSTLHWCIPAYGVYDSGGSDHNAILCIPNDTASLNRFPYFASVPLSGDVDVSGAVNAADAVLLARFVNEQAELTVTHRGAYNADTDADGLLTICDAAAILRMI